MINSAFYGRMELGECVKNDFGHLGCKDDVTGLMDGWCSGKQECLVEVDNGNEHLKNTNTDCAADLSLYMDVDYTCIRGEYSSLGTCH